MTGGSDGGVTEGSADWTLRSAVERRVAASTRNQALAALRFLYADVLEQPLPPMVDVAPARRPHVFPNVLSRDAVTRVLGAMHGVPWLMASLRYGSGLRLMECCQLRVKDVDLDRLEIRVRRGKGARDRVTMPPQSLVGPLAAHRDAARVALLRRWARDRGGGAAGGVPHLPALVRHAPAGGGP